ncbi:UPF0496 protein 4-like isoform X2 [Tasmannia lanceolata]|uniref:UPF0496 protein 4-like isoform X2 n=1 Tax=Tasmannia lanceolata TaxID=3420 RepID=UPI004064943E
MSLPHDGHRSFFPFGNPFRMILPKGSYLSPKLLALLNSFEETLAESLRKLKPKDKMDVLSLSWMRLAVESLCETHKDIKSLITDLQFPVSDWDEKWIDMYLDNSVKLLDICISFSSELSQLNQGQLLLQCVLHILDFSKDFPSLENLVRARSSLHDWMLQIKSRNRKLDSFSDALHALTGTCHFAKVKNSAKGRVLMQAMYGVEVKTIFVCSVFMSAFSGSNKHLMDLHVSEKFLWSEAFNDLQFYVNGEIKRQFVHGSVTVVKELEAVNICVEQLYATSDGVGCDGEENLQKSILSLAESAEGFTQGFWLAGVGEFLEMIVPQCQTTSGDCKEMGFAISFQVFC